MAANTAGWMQSYGYYSGLRSRAIAEIKAPAGLEIRDRTAGIFGGTDIKGLGDPVPGAPVITIKGASLFGGVSVTGPVPSTKKRHKHELH